MVRKTLFCVGSDFLVVTFSSNIWIWFGEDAQRWPAKSILVSILCAFLLARKVIAEIWLAVVCLADGAVLEGIRRAWDWCSGIMESIVLPQLQIIFTIDFMLCSSATPSPYLLTTASVCADDSLLSCLCWPPGAALSHCLNLGLGLLGHQCIAALPLSPMKRIPVYSCL